MAAISKITIDGFKAFPNSFTLDLEDGKNLLMYGENGSGKSNFVDSLSFLRLSLESFHMVVSAEHPSNIPSFSVTLLVLRALRSRLVILVQPWNMATVRFKLFE